MSLSSPMYFMLPPKRSRLNGRVVSQATQLGDLRSQRELSLFVFHENVRVDHSRGICTPDFFAGRFWRQERIERLRKERVLRHGLPEDAASPCAGGGQRVPSEVTYPDSYTCVVSLPPEDVPAFCSTSRYVFSLY